MKASASRNRLKAICPGFGVAALTRATALSTASGEIKTKFAKCFNAKAIMVTEPEESANVSLAAEGNARVTIILHSVLSRVNTK